MSDPLILDWSMYQSSYHGDPNNADQLYDPDYWTVTADFSKLKAAGVAAVILRIGIGTRKDPCFDRYLAGLRRVGIAVGYYHAYWPSDPITQADCLPGWCLVPPTFGLWADLEAGSPNFDDTNQYLFHLDECYPNTDAGIYSGGPFLNTHYTQAQQRLWAWRLLWVAGYPNFIQPVGWASNQPPYALHQYTSSFAVSGLPKTCDASVLNPQLKLDELLIEAPMLTPRGSYIGIHSIVPGQTIPMCQAAIAAGTRVPGVIYLNDGQVGVDLQTGNLTDWRLLRYYNPALDSMQGLPDWTPAQQAKFCQDYLDHIEQNASDAQIAAAHAILDTNEEDPPERLPGGADSYTKLGQTLIMLIQACEVRNAARRAAERPELHLGLLTFAQGVPEYNEDLALIATGLFEWIDRYSHWAIFHEGVFKGQKIDLDVGDPEPGSPTLFDAGPYNFRFVFLYTELLRQGRPIPRTAITEFYDGGGYPGDPVEHVKRFAYYDRMLSALPAPIAGRIAFFAGFSCNCGNTNWANTSNYDDFYNSKELREYRQLVAARANGGDMATIPDDKLASYLSQLDQTISQAQALRAALAGYLPAPAPIKVGDVVVSAAPALTIYKNATGSSPADIYAVRENYSADEGVLAVSADGTRLQVFANPPLWVNVSDVRLK